MALNADKFYAAIPNMYRSIQQQRAATFLLALAAAISCLSPLAQAQVPKAPGLGYVYPPVVRAGETTSVQFGGFDFTVDMQWFVHDAHVQLQTEGPPGDYHIPPPPYWIGPRASTSAPPIPREVRGQLTVDAAAPEGLIRWQVANANGASDTAVLFISHGPEILESRSRDFPQKLPTLPIGVSGRLSRLTEVDRYQIVPDRDGVVTVDLMARRLGADFHGVLEVQDTGGNMLTDFADTPGLDGGLAFSAVAGKSYTISVHDADFRGDRAYVYHLGITQTPRVICTIPAAGQRGASSSIEFFGFGIVTGKAVIESIRQDALFSTDASIESQQLALPTAIAPADVRVALSDVIEQASTVTEAVAAGGPQLITTPGAVTSLMRPGEVDHRFQWHAEKDEPWSISLQSRSLGSRMDVALEIRDPAGMRVADNDDLPGTTDAGLEFQTKAAGDYTVVVRNLSSSTQPSGSGTAMDIYRLQLRRMQPDFSLSVPQRVTLGLGGKLEIPVQVVRHGGFADAIRLSVEGLPEGVSVLGDGIIPADGKELKLTLESAADAAVTAKVIHIRGTAKLGDSEITRFALSSAGNNLSPRSSTETLIPHVLLAMTMPAPFDIQVIDRERQHDVHRGTTFLAELDIVRKEGFTGEIQLEMTAQQDRCRCGMRGGILTVPPGQTKVFYPCFMPEWLSTDLTRRIIVHGVAAIPDPKGNIRCVTKAGDARITMIMEGALLKLTSAASELTVTPGATFEIPFTVSRSAKLPLAVSVELIVPDEIHGLLRSEPLLLPPDQDHATLKVITEHNAALEGPWSFKVKATALQDNKWPVISEADVPAVFTGP